MPTYNGARAQRALLDRQAEIQKQQSQQQAELGQTAADAEAKRQQQAMNQSNAYQQQAMAQQAGFQQQRDATQFGYQTAGTQQQAGIQTARDQLLIQNQQQRDQAAQQHEARMQEAHVQGQISVANNQFSQQEALRLNRLKQQLEAVNEGVQNGTYSPDDGNAMRAELQTGIDPLRRRLVQSNIANEQARTQAVTQQTVQQATEFNRRQSILNQSAQDRMQMFQNPATGMWHTMQIMPDGSYAPMEMDQHAQAHMGHMYELALRGREADQTYAQRQQTNPLAVENMRLNVQHLREAMPHEVELLRQRVEQGPRAFDSRMAYEDAHTALSRFEAERGRTLLPGQVTQQAATTANLGATTAHTNISTAALNQQIEDHPTMRDLRIRTGESQIANLDLTNVRDALANQITTRNLAGGMAPQAAANIRRHIEHDLREEIAGAGRFRGTAPENRSFRHTTAPSGETDADRTTRHAREFDQEVNNRFQHQTGVNHNAGPDQGVWNAMSGAIRNSVESRVRAGTLRVPARVNREQFINDQVERETGNSLGLPAPQPFNPFNSQAQSHTPQQREVAQRFDAMREQANQRFGLLTENNAQGHQAHQLIESAMRIMGRYGSIEAMPPQMFQEYTDLRNQIRRLGLGDIPGDRPNVQPNPQPAPPQQQPQQPPQPPQNQFIQGAAGGLVPPGPWNNWGQR